MPLRKILGSLVGALLAHETEVRNGPSEGGLGGLSGCDAYLGASGYAPLLTPTVIETPCHVA